MQQLGGIDMLCTHSAGFGFAPFAGMTLELWRHVIHVELDIIFHTTQPAWRQLCDRGGSIINTASMSALRGIAVVSDELRAFQLGMHLIRPPGLGEDIAAMTLYLASDESTWVTGQNFSVDGGVTAGFR